MSARSSAALLAAARQGDESACAQVLTENAGLIWSVVRRYLGRGVELEDLYQLGCIGFIKAVKGFDFSYQTQFSTYAVPKIAGEIRRFLRDDGMVKVSRGLRERAQQIYAARQALQHALGREPALSELSQHTGLSPEEIVESEMAAAPSKSLQQETGEELTLESLLGSDSPEEGMIERLVLRAAIQELPERERLTIALRYFRGLTQQQTAHVLKVSQVQISRLEHRALEHLREKLEDR